MGKLIKTDNEELTGEETARDVYGEVMVPGMPARQEAGARLRSR
jgi:hypothetical protein